jgi:hypothetical protein
VRGLVGAVIGAVLLLGSPVFAPAGARASAEDRALSEQARQEAARSQEAPADLGDLVRSMTPVAAAGIAAPLEPAGSSLGSADELSPALPPGGPKGGQ